MPFEDKVKSLLGRNHLDHKIYPLYRSISFIKILCSYKTLNRKLINRGGDFVHFMESSRFMVCPSREISLYHESNESYFVMTMHEYLLSFTIQPGKHQKYGTCNSLMNYPHREFYFAERNGSTRQIVLNFCPTKFRSIRKVRSPLSTSNFW